jgi:hypothetical protein
MNYSKKKKIILANNFKKTTGHKKSNKRIKRLKKNIGKSGVGGARYQQTGGAVYNLGPIDSIISGDTPPPGDFFQLLQKAGLLYKSSEETRQIEKNLEENPSYKKKIGKYTLFQKGVRYFFYYTKSFNYKQSVDRYDTVGHVKEKPTYVIDQILIEQKVFPLLKRLLLGYPTDTKNKIISTDFWSRKGNYGVIVNFLRKSVVDSSIQPEASPVKIKQNGEGEGIPLMVISGLELYGFFGIKSETNEKGETIKLIDFNASLTNTQPEPMTSEKNGETNNLIIASYTTDPTLQHREEALAAISIHDPKFAATMSSMNDTSLGFGIKDPNLINMTKGFLAFIQKLGINVDNLGPIPQLDDTDILTNPEKKAQISGFLEKIASIFGQTLATNEEMQKGIEAAFTTLFPEHYSMAVRFYDKFYNPLKTLSTVAKLEKKIFETGAKTAMKINASTDKERQLVDELFRIAQTLESIARDAAQKAKTQSVAPAAKTTPAAKTNPAPKPQSTSKGSSAPQAPKQTAAAKPKGATADPNAQKDPNAQNALVLGNGNPSPPPAQPKLEGESPSPEGKGKNTPSENKTAAAITNATLVADPGVAATEASPATEKEVVAGTPVAPGESAPGEETGAGEEAAPGAATTTSNNNQQQPAPTAVADSEAAATPASLTPAPTVSLTPESAAPNEEGAEAAQDPEEAAPEVTEQEAADSKADQGAAATPEAPEAADSEATEVVVTAPTEPEAAATEAATPELEAAPEAAQDPEAPEAEQDPEAPEVVEPVEQEQEQEQEQEAAQDTEAPEVVEPAQAGGSKKSKSKSKRKTQKGKRKNSQKKSKYVKKSVKRAKRMNKLKL